MRVKIISAAAGLIGYGALVGWAVTADRYEQKMKSNQKLLGDIIDKKSRELEAAKSLLLEREGSEAADQEEGVQAEIPIEVTSEDGENEDDEPVDEAKIEETRTNLQRIIDQYTSDPDRVEEFVETAQTFETDLTPPFVISRKLYAWDAEEGDDYDKITLTYYPRARILLDDEDDVIDDVANVVGWKNLSRFGDESDDGDVVYVRNRHLRTDFEIVRDTENQPPAHVRYGMSKDEFETNKAAGLIRFRPGDV